MVVASLALLVALGGSSYAAISIGSGNIRNGSIRSEDIGTGQVHSSDILNNDVQGIDVRDGTIKTADVGDHSLLAKDFALGQLPAGAQGAKGDQGPPGNPGAPGNAGAQGSPAASWITGSLQYADSTSAGSSKEFGVSGPIPNLSTAAFSRAPNAQMVVRDLFVDAVLAPGAGATRRYTILDDGAATAVTCDIKDSASTCDSASATATIDAGSRVQIRSEVVSGGSNAAGISNPVWGFRATTP